MKRRASYISVIVVLASALASGLFYLRYSSRRAREATLKLDLITIRLAIDNYTLDKQQPPQSFQDLVNAHFLKEIPTDPFTRKKDWVPYFSDTVLSPEQKATGIADVHSASGKVGSNDVAYSEWRVVTRQSEICVLSSNNRGWRYQPLDPMSGNACRLIGS